MSGHEKASRVEIEIRRLRGKSQRGVRVEPLTGPSGAQAVTAASAGFSRRKGRSFEEGYRSHSRSAAAAAPTIPANPPRMATMRSDGSSRRQNTAW